MNTLPDSTPERALRPSLGRAPTWWMWPVWLVGGLHAGLRESALADARWATRTPVAGLGLPAIAILIPVLVTLLHASTPPSEQPAPAAFAFVIRDVFTESLPFMAAALLLGIISPAAGALVVVVFAAGNLGVTGMSGELVPVAGATFGRLVSYALLWLLAVELPLLGRWVVEWTIRTESAAPTRRVTGVALGAAAIGAMTFVWSQAVPLLITVVYFRTSIWGGPFLVGVQPLQTHGLSLAQFGAAAGLVVFGLRYVPAQPRLSPRIQPTVTSVGPWRVVGIVAPVLIPLALLAGLIHKPIDLAVLLLGLVGARPLGTALASVTGLAKVLAHIPLPLRLALGITVAGLVDKLYFSRFFSTDVSRFFDANVAIALGLFVISTFAASPRARTERANAALFVLAATALLAALPAPAFADNCGDWIDCVGDTTRAAFAAAAAAAIAAAKFFWDWAKDVFGAPQPIGTLDKLASEEGAAAQDGAMSALRNRTAQQARGNGQDDRADQIQSMTNGEFYRAAKNGDFGDLGISPF